jgi:putative hemolysin
MKKFIKENWLKVVIVVIAIVLVSLASKFLIHSKNTTNTQIANPASVNCIKNGGKLSNIDKPEGQVGMCTFSDGSVCEEWAFFRGNCNLGITPATPPADWKTYRNVKYGFQVLYPSDWKVSESSPGAIAISGVDGGVRFLGVEVSPPYVTAVDELSALAVQFGTQVESVTIKGISGIRRDDEGGGRTYYLEHGRTYVEIMTNKEQMDNNENIGRVITTFTFTP